MILYPKGAFFVQKKHSFRTQKGRFFASKAAEPSAVGKDNTFVLK